MSYALWSISFFSYKFNGKARKVVSYMRYPSSKRYKYCIYLPFVDLDTVGILIDRHGPHMRGSLPIQRAVRFFWVGRTHFNVSANCGGRTFTGSAKVLWIQRNLRYWRVSSWLLFLGSQLVGTCLATATLFQLRQTKATSRHETIAYSLSDTASFYPLNPSAQHRLQVCNCVSLVK